MREAGWGSDGRGFALGGYVLGAWSVAGTQAAGRGPRLEKSWEAGQQERLTARVATVNMPGFCLELRQIPCAYTPCQSAFFLTCSLGQHPQEIL